MGVFILQVIVLLVITQIYCRIPAKNLFTLKHVTVYIFEKCLYTYCIIFYYITRKLNKFPGLFCRILSESLDEKSRSPPVTILSILDERGKYDGKKNFLKNFLITSIISDILPVLVMKGRNRHFLLRLLCRGEVIPLKLTPQQKEIVRKKFCTYCIKVLHGEALNYLDEMKRLREREVSFSELIPDEWNKLCTYDGTVIIWH